MGNLLSYFGNIIGYYSKVWDKIGIFFAFFLIWGLIKKRDEIHRFYVYLFSIILFLSLNPIFAYICERIFLKATYWRIFWLLPENIFMAYVFVKLWEWVPDRKKQIVIGIIGAVFLVLIANKTIFSFMEKPDNLYKLNRETVEVADILLAQEEEPVAVVADGLLVQIRQYSSKIKLLYGRNIYPDFMGGCWLYDFDMIHKQLRSKHPDYALTRYYATNYGAKYIVWNKKKNKATEEEMQGFGYELIAETDSYRIYKM